LSHIQLSCTETTTGRAESDGRMRVAGNAFRHLRNAARSPLFARSPWLSGNCGRGTAPTAVAPSSRRRQ
jgi:hypothetical protein